MLFKDDASGIIDLDTFEAIEHGFVSEIDSDVMSTDPSNNQSIQLGGRKTWSSPLVTKPSKECMTHCGRIIRTLDRLMYAPTVELHYLGEMVELDNVELTNS